MKKEEQQAEQLFIAEARKSLAVHLAIGFLTDDGKAAVPPPHIEKIVIPAIEDDSLGHTVIIAPPGSAKTNTMIAACAWWLGNDPSQHIAYVCNSGPKAVERSLVVRDMIERNSMFQKIFPECKPDKTRGWSQDAWTLQRKNFADKNPSFNAVGTTGDILGARVHRFIFDDIADDENMKTELQRKQLRLRLEQTYLTRMDDPLRKRAIMIGTRWHEDDPIQWAIDQGWHVVHIPALDEEGNAYWPARWPRQRLACEGEHNLDPSGKCYTWNGIADNCMKRQLGGDGFAKQYMGVVTNDETAIFKRGNWRFYKEHEVTNLHRGGIFVDLAHDEKTTSDFTVIAAVETDGTRRYWRRLIRKRLSFPEVVRAIKDVRTVFDYPVIIEDVTNSKPLIQQLQREMWGVIPFALEGRSKQARAEAAAPSHEAGDWFLPEAGWTDDFINEHAGFPFAKHDDMVDTSSMMHIYFSKRLRPSSKAPNLKPFRREWSTLSA